MRTTLLIALLALLPTIANAAVITYARTDFPSGRPPERLMAPSSSDADLYEEVKQTGNALHTYDAYTHAGERNEDSSTGTDYSSVAGEWAMKSIAYNGDLAARTIFAGPCLIAGIEVTTAMSAHASQIESNGTSVYPIPASRAAGIYTFPGPAIFEQDCVWDPGSLSAGAMNVWYRPLGAGSTWAP